MPTADPPESVADHAPQPKPLLPALYTSAEVPMSQWGTNLDVTKPFGWAKVLRCLQPADWMPADKGEILLDVVGWVAHPIEQLNKDTGELEVKTRLVLIGRDGKTAALRGEWNIRNLRVALASYPGEWPKCGMPCRVYTESSRNPNMSEYGTFEFRPDLLPPEYTEV